MTPDVRLSEGELVLSPDFAARVLAQADAVIVLRRRRGSAALVAGVLAIASIAGGAVLHTAFSPSARTSQSQLTYVARSNDLSAPTLTDKDEARAMRYLFPDASPLAQFVETYSTAMTGIGADEQTATADDTQDEWL